jgi:hypothetical protein
MGSIAMLRGLFKFATGNAAIREVAGEVAFECVKSRPPLRASPATIPPKAIAMDKQQKLFFILQLHKSFHLSSRIDFMALVQKLSKITQINLNSIGY